MTDLRGTYDVNDKPDAGFTILPAGEYVVKIERAEWRETKNKDGQYLQINMAVAEGEYQGSLIVDRLNLKNRSEMAVKIARGQFAALREAVGVLEPRDTADLQGIRFRIVLRCAKRNDVPGKMTNEVARYIKHGETTTTPQQRDAPWKRNTAPAPANPDGQEQDASGVPF